MKLTQISNLINTVLVPNLLGESATIAEDLSNVVDLGTAISDMDADSLKDYMKQFAVGVIENWVDTRSYKRETYGLFIDAIDYGGAIQRTKARLLKSYDTPILTLDNANTSLNPVDYNDGKFYGTEFDSKIFNKDVSFMLPYSIPVEMFKKSFTSAAGVRKLVALIESNADNTLTAEVNALAKSVLRKLALSCATARKIKLFTLYNTEFGFSSGDDGYVTLTTWKNDTNFKLWCEALIIQLRKRVTEFNRVCNDGTIEVFCPEEDTNIILLSEFGTALDFAQSSVYHKELTDVGSYFTTNYWQNSSDELIPQISSTSVHDEIVETVSGSSTTISHMVGMIYDRYAGGITNKLNKTTVDYIAKGDFNTFFHHMVNEYWIDTRNTAIILTLE